MLSDAAGVFEQESRRMEHWLATWIGIEKAQTQTRNAMATMLRAAGAGWVSRHGPLQLLYQNGQTSKVLSAAAVGRTGPANGMKNWEAPTSREIEEMCRVYVGIGFACSMAQLPEEQWTELVDQIRQLSGHTSSETSRYKGVQLSRNATRGLSKLSQGLGLLAARPSTWEYAMGRLWQHEIDQTRLWVSLVDRCFRRL